MKKITYYSELTYIIGLATIALGVTFMEKSDFGVSMVVAPAYVLHRKLVLLNPFFTFGVTEMFTQVAVLLLIILITRKFRVAELFCFVTAVIYGLILDGWIALFANLPTDTIVYRAIYYVAGMLICSLGVAQVLHTYVPPQSYDLFTKNVSRHFNKPIRTIKTIYDLSSLTIALILSFLFFGFGTFIGVKLGTLFCALINGTLIGFFVKLLDKTCEFKDLLPLRKICEG